MTRCASGVLFVMLAVGSAACGDEAATISDPPKPARPVPPADTGDADTDADGVCNATEEDFGTDASSGDSDADGISDLVEIAYDLGELDASRPAPERLAILAGRPGASIEFPVRATVRGDGDGQLGTFEVEPAVYDDRRDAETFFTGALAVSAEPHENVRGIDYGAEKFTSVLGETRLAFSLRFEQPIEEIEPCVRGYPFRYTITSTRGDVTNVERYLLVVVPDRTTFKNGPWCGVDPCF